MKSTSGLTPVSAWSETKTIELFNPGAPSTPSSFVSQGYKQFTNDLGNSAFGNFSFTGTLEVGSTIDVNWAATDPDGINTTAAFGGKTADFILLDEALFGMRPLIEVVLRRLHCRQFLARMIVWNTASTANRPTSMAGKVLAVSFNLEDQLGKHGNKL